MKIGVSTHIHVYKPLDAKLLADIKKAGFESVELYCNHPHWPDYDVNTRKVEITSHCADLSLDINSVHTPFFRNLDDAKRGKWYSISTGDKNIRRETVGRIIESVTIAEHADIKAAVIHVGAPGEVEDTNTWERMFYSLEEILSASSALGITLALENITNDFSRGNCISSFIRESGLKRIGCCYDSGHATIYNRTIDELNEMSPHLVTTHIHDTTDGKDNHLLPFEGDIDWTALSGQLAENGYDGDIIIETKDIDGTFEMLEKSAGAARKIRKMIEDSERSQ